MTCIDNLKTGVKQSRTRQAFFEYLDSAPQLKFPDLDDPTKCGELREYFEYDPDFVDDDRICEEVENLQVSRSG